jgi:gamma-glutamyltranspeptidase / glutathione hydrolase
MLAGDNGMKRTILLQRKLTIISAVLLSTVMFLCSAQTLNISTKGKAAVGKEAMATTASPLASKAAIEILQQGGNAVDAACAAAFAIGVVEPDGSGVGGGGGMVVYLSKQKKPVYINFYPKASENINSISYDPKRDARSPKAILVPGTVAGLTAALEQFGTLPLSTVLQPAIRYAEKGFPIDETLSKIILDNSDMLQNSPSTAAIYLKDGFPLAEGDTIRQVELARTLRTIAEKGRKGFYEGPIAQKMVEEVTKNGGALTMEDLRTYQAETMEPVKGTYRGYDIITAGLPQSGATVLEALNMLENENLKRLGSFTQSAESFHLVAEVMRRAYADRQAFIGDPHFGYCPLKGITSKEFAHDRFTDINRSVVDPPEYRKTKAGNPMPYDEGRPAKKAETVEQTEKPIQIDDRDDDGKFSGDKGDDMFDSWGGSKKRSKEHVNKDEETKDTTIIERDTKEQEARYLPDAPPFPGSAVRPAAALTYEESHAPVQEGGHTTHLAVIDKEGNVVSLTQTLGTFFGSGFTSEGVLFNCAMSNFGANSSDNAPEPKKQPRSSIAPTIILKEGKTFMTVGSPGATRIPATVVELIVNVIDFGMNADDANNAPRFFLQKTDDYLHLESRFSDEIQGALKKKGHHLQVYGEFDLFFGGAQMILVDSATGAYYGSADPRRGGVAIGY